MASQISFLFSWWVKVMSHYFGKAAHFPWPPFLTQTLIRLFIRFYGVKEEEAEKPISEYRSLGEFFSRRLKPGVRATDGFGGPPLLLGSQGFVHPCDGVLVGAGSIHRGLFIQAKGSEYTIEELLGGDLHLSRDLAGLRESPSPLEGGFFLTYYLSPRDYHRVHAPCGGVLSSVIHMPGHLWPVNKRSVGSILKLYAVNERVVFPLRMFFGASSQKSVNSVQNTSCDTLPDHSAYVYIIMVGATNVGQISLSFDEDFATNLPEDFGTGHRYSRRVRLYPESQPHVFTPGKELGRFHMGSTVIVLYPSQICQKWREMGKSEESWPRVGMSVRVGDELFSH